MNVGGGKQGETIDIHGTSKNFPDSEKKKKGMQRKLGSWDDRKTEVWRHPRRKG